MKTATVRARIEEKLKKKVETLLKKIGLTTSEAITLYLTQINLTKGIPFPIKLPSKKKVKLTKPLRRGKKNS